MVTDLQVYIFDRSLFDNSCFWHLIQSAKHLILIWFETVGPVGHLGSLRQVEHGVTRLPSDFPLDSEEVGHDELVGGHCSVSLQQHQPRVGGAVDV